MPTDDKRYVFNGINGETGEYLVSPMSADEVLAMFLGRTRDRSEEAFLTRVWRRMHGPSMAAYGINDSDVTEAGWAVVFHEDEDQAVVDAMQPLLEHRRRQINDDQIVKVLKYRDGETRRDWLTRHGVAAGNPEPRLVPHYLLLVGSPDRIPFLFTHLLDVEYAVGRLHFDSVGDYTTYVQSVIEYETGSSIPNSREAVFFAPRNIFDRATQLSADLLVAPLADGVPPGADTLPKPPVAERAGFATRKLWGDTATQSALRDVLTTPQGEEIPAFLFSASHGMGWRKAHPEQVDRQGALICQDWPGGCAMAPEHCFAASDLPGDARVHGMISFHFACYSAGTPRFDRFLHAPGAAAPEIAGEAFLAALPKALLSHANGGALAIIGHVEQAFGFSFLTAGVGAQLEPFRDAVARILHGQPVGHSLKLMNQRYAILSTELTARLEEIDRGGLSGSNIDATELADAWLERNDAEGYLVIGDPAVRLRVQLM